MVFIPWIYFASQLALSYHKQTLVIIPNGEYLRLVSKIDTLEAIKIKRRLMNAEMQPLVDKMLAELGSVQPLEFIG